VRFHPVIERSRSTARGKTNESIIHLQDLIWETKNAAIHISSHNFTALEICIFFRILPPWQFSMLRRKVQFRNSALSFLLALKALSWL